MKIFIPNKRDGISHAHGFTLIEVLVSLVILAIGLLGIAKLMLFSSHANDSAYLRSQATALAYEILDSMRANRQEASTNHTYDTPAAVPAVIPGALCLGATCTSAAQVALYDVYQWGLRLSSSSGVVPAGALPNGQGIVTTATNASQQTSVTIVVQWDDSAAQTTLNIGAPTTQQVTLETIL